MGPAERRELELLFPGRLQTVTDPARTVMPGRIARKLAERHLRNAKALLAPA